MTEPDATKAETRATFELIKSYVLQHTGLKVSCLYIVQVKAKHGITERDCYNKARAEGNRVPKRLPILPLQGLYRYDPIMSGLPSAWMPRINLPLASI